MSKGFLTPKAIGNRIKAKGLQKLRWYCQMCQKQCRDENGMRCHMTSEGHLRQMRVFAENPNRVIDEYSREFERGYLQALSHGHGTKRVSANRVYQEYIGDKTHVHMNSTCWTSLNGFVMFLGKEGKAVVDETEKGWFVQYIDRDPKVLARQAQSEMRKKAELDDEDRARRMIDAQIAAANKSLEDSDDRSKKRKVDEEDEVLSDLPAERGEISLSIGGSLFDKNKKKPKVLMKSVFDTSAPVTDSKVPDDTTSSSSTKPLISMSLSKPKPATAVSFSVGSTSSSTKTSGSVMDQIKQQEEIKKEKGLQSLDAKDRHEHWLAPGILVRILNQKLSNGKFYKKVGVVKQVIDTFVGELRILGPDETEEDAVSGQDSIPGKESSVTVRLDQEELETVVPKVV